MTKTPSAVFIQNLLYFWCFVSNFGLFSSSACKIDLSHYLIVKKQFDQGRLLLKCRPFLLLVHSPYMSLSQRVQSRRLTASTNRNRRLGDKSFKKEENALEDKCKVIAVANQKGGVGKTTTAVNLGVALGQAGKRVLLIDADPQGSLTRSCKIQSPDDLDVTLSELMANEMTGEDKDYILINNAIEHFENVDLIPSNISLSGTETALFNCMSRESVLKRTIEPLRKHYDVILVDCMPSLGMMTINALVAADSVIIPCEPSYLSVKGLDLLLHSIARVKRQINPDLKIEGVLMTMVDSRTNNARDITAALRDAMGININVFNIEIPRSVRATECPNVGKSIFVHDPGGKVAEAYEALAREVIALERQTQVRPRSYSVR